MNKKNKNLNSTETPHLDCALREWKISHLIGVSGIVFSIASIYLEWNGIFSYIMGGGLFLFIWMVIIIQKKINDIKSRKRIIYLLNILLQEMKDEGVSDLNDLKRNKK